MVTRRIQAGYLPIGGLVADKSAETGWRAVVDATLVGQDCRDEFVAFARMEAKIIAKTLNSEMSREDSWVSGFRGANFAPSEFHVQSVGEIAARA